MRFKLPSRMASWFGETLLSVVWSMAPVVSSFGFFSYGLWQGGLGLLSLGLVMVLLSLTPTHVLVGKDGLTIHWLKLSRFLRYDAIALVERHTRRRVSRSTAQEVSTGVQITLRSGQQLYLVCNNNEAERDIVAHTNMYLKAHQKHAPADVHALSRGERSASDWLVHLRGLMTGGVGYRDSSMTADSLWTVVENPKSEEAERAAAAIALRAHLGEEARPRLRVAIDACASPKLRVALEAIEEQADDREVETSIEKLQARVAK